MTPLTPVQRDLAEQYAPLARRIAVDIARTHTRHDHDELIGDAYEGLCLAARRFDPANPSGAGFATYASARIRGQVLDAMRDRDLLSRHDRALERRIRHARAAYTIREHRFPTRPQLAAELDWPLHRLLKILERVMRVDALRTDEPSLHEDPPFDDWPDTTPSMETVAFADATHKQLHHLIDLLPQRLQAVVRFRYMVGMTQEEIAGVLDVSATRVCQMESEALRRLSGMRGVENLRQAA